MEHQVLTDGFSFHTEVIVTPDKDVQKDEWFVPRGEENMFVLTDETRGGVTSKKKSV